MAIATVLLTALAVFNLVPQPATPQATTAISIQPQPPPTGSTASATGAPVRAWRVTLDTVTAGPAVVAADGSFENVFTQRENIVLLGQPTAPGTDWVPVPATVEAVNAQTVTGDSGRWHASRPGVTETYQWSAVVVPALSGAGDLLEDLRRNGPDSSFVLAASEIVETE